MTQDEIIEMAKKAWFDAGEGWVFDGWFTDRTKAFEVFANLVAAKEREACAKVCDEFNFGQSPMMIQRAIRIRGEA